jgi:hypothetical protein
MELEEQGDTFREDRTVHYSSSTNYEGKNDGEQLE